MVVDEGSVDAAHMQCPQYSAGREDVLFSPVSLPYEPSTPLRVGGIDRLRARVLDLGPGGVPIMLFSENSSGSLSALTH